MVKLDLLLEDLKANFSNYQGTKKKHLLNILYQIVLLFIDLYGLTTLKRAEQSDLHFYSVSGIYSKKKQLHSLQPPKTYEMAHNLCVGQISK